MLIQDLQNAPKIKNFLCKTLTQTAHTFELETQILQTNTSFTLEAKGEEQNLLDFTNALSKNLPLSLQWTFKELRILESLSPTHSLPNPQESSNLLTPLELEKISQKDSSAFCDLWGSFIDFTPQKITFLKDNQKLPLNSKKELQEALQYLSTLLKNQQSIFLKTPLGKKEIILFDENNPPKIQSPYIFMPFCLNNAQSLFRISAEECQALATLEKPLITLKPKSILKALFPTHEVPCILPFDPILLLLSKFLESHSGFYLLEPTKKLNNGICQFFKTDDTPLEISVGKNSLILKHHFETTPATATYPELLAFKNTIKSQNLTQTNALYLGNHPTHFMLYFNQSFKTPIEFIFQSNLTQILEILKVQNTTTKSLLKNFTKSNESLIEQLQSFPTHDRFSSNLLDLLGLCGILLDLHAPFPLTLDFDSNLKAATKAVLQKAGEFVGAKGPRIDFRLEKDKEGKIYLDTLRTLRSVMSFKLAGVESELLCFGILDSMAEFFANLSRDMEENYSTKGIIICGEMFLNKQFLDQFIHYLPKDSEVLGCEIMDFI
ncbi:hypothetical protein HCMG_00907 [Helicobacter canadensis MIT 98-5491]|nr:hypothetical protein HCMG_00907 [Helicobacter canadensis MIT 98-5491]